jgi:hypothetical protein
MLQERIYRWRAQGTGITLRGGLVGSLAGGSSTGDLRVEEGSGDGHLSPYGPCWYTRGEGVCSPATQRLLKEGSGNGISLSMSAV